MMTKPLLVFFLCCCSIVGAFHVVQPLAGNNKNALLSRTHQTSFPVRAFFRSSTDTTTTISTEASSLVPPGSKRELLLKQIGTLRSLSSLQERLASNVALGWSKASKISVQTCKERAYQMALQYWWTVPTFLALVPLYTTYVLGIGDAAMPHWWPVTPMDHVVKAPDASMVLSVFLGSNIAFFVAGAYLVRRFPFVPRTTTNSAVTTTSPSASSLLLNRLSTLAVPKFLPTRQTWLGLLLLASGVISTVFHTEQALGSFAMANSLCYLDHAVAGTSTFYFFHACGVPSRKIVALGIAGLAALSIPLPGYAWLHSTWHFLSALTAVLWALESHAGKQKTAVETTTIISDEQTYMPEQRQQQQQQQQ